MFNIQHIQARYVSKKDRKKGRKKRIQIFITTDLIKSVFLQRMCDFMVTYIGLMIINTVTFNNR